MKDRLDKIFKEKLEHFEAPYNPSAWDAVNSRLDANKVTTMGSAGKWIIGSAILISALLTSVYFLNPNESSNSEENAKAAIVEKQSVKKTAAPVYPNQTETASKAELNENESGIGKATSDLNDENEQNEDSNQLGLASQNHDLSQLNIDKEQKARDQIDKETTEKGEEPSGNTSSIDENKPAQKTSFVPGVLSNTQICAGENLIISNKGKDKQIVKAVVANSIILLSSGEQYVYQPEISSTIIFLNHKGEQIGMKSFEVLENPSAEFSVTANIFENGLPITECETYGDYASIEWTFDDKHTLAGKEVKHHFFTKGEYEINLKVTDFNGCENTVTKPVRINENYNLMAVDAFAPNDADPRRKVFMPYALTERDVSFTLTIVNPRDNGVLYTTKDPSKGWTGIDQRTGKMSQNGKVYIWKVQLENALPHERKVYAGTIVLN
jgi:hypothetical protein